MDDYCCCNKNLSSECLQKHNFQINYLLGIGAFGRVYAATCMISNAMVAVKLLSKDAARATGMIEKVILEVSLHAKLTSMASEIEEQGIVYLYDFFEDADHVFLVIELCNSKSVYDLLRESGPLNEPLVQHLAHQLFSCLHFLHSHGYIHRDLKLSNLLLHRDDLDASLPYASNCPYILKIGDFGLTTSLQSSPLPLQEPPTICGTPAYMSPELARGEHYATGVDVYAAGCLIAAMLAGRLPHPVPDAEKYHDSSLQDSAVAGSGISGHVGSRIQDMVLFLRDQYPLAADFLDKITHPTSEHRWNVMQALEHPWLAGVVESLETNREEWWQRVSKEGDDIRAGRGDRMDTKMDANRPRCNEGPMEGRFERSWKVEKVEDMYAIKDIFSFAKQEHSCESIPETLSSVDAECFHSRTSSSNSNGLANDQTISVDISSTPTLSPPTPTQSIEQDYPTNSAPPMPLSMSNEMSSYSRSNTEKYPDAATFPLEGEAEGYPPRSRSQLPQPLPFPPVFPSQSVPIRWDGTSRSEQDSTLSHRRQEDFATEGKSMHKSTDSATDTTEGHTIAPKLYSSIALAPLSQHDTLPTSVLAVSSSAVTIPSSVSYSPKTSPTTSALSRNVTTQSSNSNASLYPEIANNPLRLQKCLSAIEYKSIALPTCISDIDLLSTVGLEISLNQKHFAPNNTSSPDQESQNGPDNMHFHKVHRGVKGIDNLTYQKAGSVASQENSACPSIGTGYATPIATADSQSTHMITAVYAPSIDVRRTRSVSTYTESQGERLSAPRLVVRQEREPLRDIIVLAKELATDRIVPATGSTFIAQETAIQTPRIPEIEYPPSTSEHSMQKSNSAAQQPHAGQSKLQVATAEPLQKDNILTIEKTQAPTLTLGFEAKSIAIPHILMPEVLLPLTTSISNSPSTPVSHDEKLSSAADGAPTSTPDASSTPTPLRGTDFQNTTMESFVSHSTTRILCDACKTRSVDVSLSNITVDTQGSNQSLSTTADKEATKKSGEFKLESSSVASQAPPRISAASPVDSFSALAVQTSQNELPDTPIDRSATFPPQEIELDDQDLQLQQTHERLNVSTIMRKEELLRLYSGTPTSDSPTVSTSHSPLLSELTNLPPPFIRNISTELSPIEGAPYSLQVPSSSSYNTHRTRSESTASTPSTPSLDVPPWTPSKEMLIPLLVQGLPPGPVPALDHRLVIVAEETDRNSSSDTDSPTILFCGIAPVSHACVDVTIGSSKTAAGGDTFFDEFGSISMGYVVYRAIWQSDEPESVRVDYFIHDADEPNLLVPQTVVSYNQQWELLLSKNQVGSQSQQQINNPDRQDLSSSRPVSSAQFALDKLPLWLARSYVCVYASIYLYLATIPRFVLYSKSTALAVMKDGPLPTIRLMALSAAVNKDSTISNVTNDGDEASTVLETLQRDAGRTISKAIHPALDTGALLLHLLLQSANIKDLHFLPQPSLPHLAYLSSSLLSHLWCIEYRLSDHRYFLLPPNSVPYIVYLRQPSRLPPAVRHYDHAFQNAPVRSLQQLPTVAMALYSSIMNLWTAHLLPLRTELCTRCGGSRAPDALNFARPFDSSSTTQCLCGANVRDGEQRKKRTRDFSPFMFQSSVIEMEPSLRNLLQRTEMIATWSQDGS